MPIGGAIRVPIHTKRDAPVCRVGGAPDCGVPLEEHPGIGFVHSFGSDLWYWANEFVKLLFNNIG